MKMVMTWMAFLMVFGFAMFLGLDRGHASVQSWAVDQEEVVAIPTPSPSPSVSPSPSPQPLSLSEIDYTPTNLEALTDATGSLLQKSAQQGVEWSVALFDELLN